MSRDVVMVAFDREAEARAEAQHIAERTGCVSCEDMCDQLVSMRHTLYVACAQRDALRSELEKDAIRAHNKVLALRERLERADGFIAEAHRSRDTAMVRCDQWATLHTEAHDWLDTARAERDTMRQERDTLRGQLKRTRETLASRTRDLRETEADMRDMAAAWEEQG